MDEKTAREREIERTLVWNSFCGGELQVRNSASGFGLVWRLVSAAREVSKASQIGTR